MLARWFKQQGRNLLLVGADLQRPAAIEQLRTLGRQVDVPVVSRGDGAIGGEGGDPVEVARLGLDEARRLGRDVVIVDTAGRLSIDAELMDQMSRIAEVTQPHYTFLVVDAMTGQDAVTTAENFHAALSLDGVILTKLDGDARAARPSPSRRSWADPSPSRRLARSWVTSTCSILTASPAASSAWVTC
ncbi:MAG: hypothetical protein WKF43_16240 [Acidimicrobiales bacterium]